MANTLQYERRTASLNQLRRGKAILIITVNGDFAVNDDRHIKVVTLRERLVELLIFQMNDNQPPTCNRRFRCAEATSHTFDVENYEIECTENAIKLTLTKENADDN
ncbi:uncharacterized protein [Argopecten irradians]|uniref:uncharacterized protein n=1 Tax=Argopecten irradians TaxID=31199 RepID=UPI0037148D94